MTDPVSALVEPVAWLVERFTDDGKPISSSLRFYEEPSTPTVKATALVPATAISSLQGERDALAKDLAGARAVIEVQRQEILRHQKHIRGIADFEAVLSQKEPRK